MKIHQVKMILTCGAVALLGWLAVAYGTEIDPSSYPKTGVSLETLNLEVAR